MRNLGNSTEEQTTSLHRRQANRWRHHQTLRTTFLLKYLRWIWAGPGLRDPIFETSTVLADYLLTLVPSSVSEEWKTSQRLILFWIAVFLSRRVYVETGWKIHLCAEQSNLQTQSRSQTFVGRLNEVVPALLTCYFFFFFLILEKILPLQGLENRTEGCR